MSLILVFFFVVTEMKFEDENMKYTVAVADWAELYECGMCDQAFTNSNDLLEHQEDHTESL